MGNVSSRFWKRRTMSGIKKGDMLLLLNRFWCCYKVFWMHCNELWVYLYCTVYNVWFTPSSPCLYMLPLSTGTAVCHYAHKVVLRRLKTVWRTSKKQVPKCSFEKREKKKRRMQLMEDIFRLPPSRLWTIHKWMVNYDAWCVNTQGPGENNSSPTANDFQVRRLSPQLGM